MMNIETSVTVAQRMVVETGGGEWVGLQDSFIEGRETLVLFNAPVSRTTLALPASLLTVDNVKNKIQTANREFVKRRIGVPYETLKGLSDRLKGLSAEISNLIIEG